jgi:hypothetical protein
MLAVREGRQLVLGRREVGPVAVDGALRVAEHEVAHGDASAAARPRSAVEQLGDRGAGRARAVDDQPQVGHLAAEHAAGVQQGRQQHHLLRVEADRPGVDARELAEEHGLTFHHGERGVGGSAPPARATSTAWC